MQTVTVSRKTLLERIKANRETHHKIVLEALDGYRKAVIKRLDDMITVAKLGKKIVTRVNLIQPSDHTKDYDAVLDMLELSVDDEIELTQSEFRAYVRDEWSWKDQFYLSNRGYSQTASLSAETDDDNND